ncbi:MAG: GH32 C-terminal domain-containing protein [Propionibacteriaceae bacterium]|nr:GH32 C-terminal domain-containing protein [Propionibacteriaceae bacterium]
MSEPVFVKPLDGWVGDVIPFTAGGGCAQLYYLHDARDPSRPGMAWHCYETDDFAAFADLGVSLPQGGESAPDLNVYTGSVIESAGVRHAFYTGYNARFHAPGRPAQQLVMHATAEAGGAWQKHPDHTFGAPEGYEPVDFRDPFVFRPEEDGPWRLLVIARRRGGADRRRGVILEYVSTDLASWAFEGEFWAPNRYVAIECPEVFLLAGTWYLVYSEFSDRFATHYRTGPTAHGPWSVPMMDTVDGRGFYAAKSLEHAGRRYFAGWIPTRAGETDDGAWEWAGSLAVHQARALEDGTLAFGMPSALAESFRQRGTVEPRPVVGDWSVTSSGWRASAPDSSAVAVTDNLPDQYLFEATIDADPHTVECGVVLRASDDGSEGYLIRIEPRRNRLVFDRWPRPRTGPAQWQISGDVPFAPELERQLPATGGRYTLRIVVDGTICVTYVNDQVAMSARMYDRRAGSLGFFVGEGAATFTNVSIATR